MKRQSPCYLCGDRTEYGLCHMTCEKFIEYDRLNKIDQATRQAIKEKEENLSSAKHRGKYRVARTHKK